MGLTHIKTETGFECDLDPVALDDAELLDLLLDFDAGDLTAYGRISTKLLGKTVKEKLYNYCRTEDGRVPWDRLGQELGDILRGFDSKKK